MIGVIEGLTILTMAVVAAWSCARWVVEPLERAAANSRAHGEFTNADLLCLLAQVLLLLASIQVAWWTGRLNSEALPLAFLLFVAVVGFWWGSVVFIERAGVRNAWHRVFLLIIGIPVAVLGSLILAGILAMLFLDLIGPTDEKWILLPFVALALVMLGLLVGVRLAIRRIVAEAQRPGGE